MFFRPWESHPGLLRGIYRDIVFARFKGEHAAAPRQCLCAALNHQAGLYPSLVYSTANVTPNGLFAVPIESCTGTAAPVEAPWGTVRLICISLINPGAEAA